MPSAAAQVDVVPADLGERATALGAVAYVERVLAWSGAKG